MMQTSSVADAIPPVEWDGVASEARYGDLLSGYFPLLLIHHEEIHVKFPPGA